MTVDVAHERALVVEDLIQKKKRHMDCYIYC
jgi:hypothetical protein